MEEERARGRGRESESERGRLSLRGESKGGTLLVSVGNLRNCAGQQCAITTARTNCRGAVECSWCVCFCVLVCLSVVLLPASTNNATGRPPRSHTNTLLDAAFVVPQLSSSLACIDTQRNHSQPKHRPNHQRSAQRRKSHNDSSRISALHRVIAFFFQKRIEHWLFKASKHHKKKPRSYYN